MSAIAHARPGSSGAGPWRGVDLKTQLPIAGGFLLLVAVAAGSLWLFFSGHRVAETVNHTLQTRSKAYELLTIVQDAETGQRGYLLSNNRWYLTPYIQALSGAAQVIADLRVLVRHSEVQTATLDRLKRLIDAKFAELAATVALNDKGDIAGAIRIVKNNKGNHYMASIREVIGQFEAEEERAQAVQSAGAEKANLMLAIASLVGIVTIFLLAGYTLAATRRATKGLLTARDDLRHTNENLESIVAERIAELRVANEEIQRFAYIVSHDLRAPLVNVMGFTSELDAARGDIAAFLKEVEAIAPQLVTTDRRMTIETDLPEALGFIRTSTAKMDRLINAILKLSREGRRVLAPQKIDIAELLRAQGQSLAQQLDTHDAALEVQDDLPEIVSDRLAIEQIFGNLIENAAKYLAPGRPGRIAVTGAPHGAFVRYDVADNGRGIEANDFERIFELFRRSGEQNTPGEGIGLAYVRNLARRLGGNVTVKSELGVGSTFTVMLPAAFQSKLKAG